MLIPALYKKGGGHETYSPGNLNTLEKNMRSKIYLQSLKCPRSRAIEEKIYEYLFAKFGLIQNKSSIRYIKL